MRANSFSDILASTTDLSIGSGKTRDQRLSSIKTKLNKSAPASGRDKYISESISTINRLSK